MRVPLQVIDCRQERSIVDGGKEFPPSAEIQHSFLRQKNVGESTTFPHFVKFPQITHHEGPLPRDSWTLNIAPGLPSMSSKGR